MWHWLKIVQNVWFKYFLSLKFWTKIGLLFSRNWFAGCVVFSNDGVLSKYWRTFFRWTDFSQPLANHVCTKIRFCQCCRSVTEEQHKRNSRKFWKNIVNNFYTFFVILGGSLWLTPFKLLVGIHDPLGTAFASIRAHHRSGVRIFIIQRLFQ